MTPEQFAYWLNGFFEMENPATLDKKKTQQIKDHLALVFDKKTPERNKKAKTKGITMPDLSGENDDFPFGGGGSRKICTAGDNPGSGSIPYC